MAITLGDAQHAFHRSGFTITSITAKLNELRSKRSGRVLYMYTDQGFPDHADVIVHPETEPSPILAIPDVTPNKRKEFRFGSNMRAFPKRLNEGADEQHFGRALYVCSPEAIEALCRLYDA
jgi:hypothetical protein